MTMSARENHTHSITPPAMDDDIPFPESNFEPNDDFLTRLYAVVDRLAVAPDTSVIEEPWIDFENVRAQMPTSLAVGIRVGLQQLRDLDLIRWSEEREQAQIIRHGMGSKSPHREQGRRIMKQAMKIEAPRITNPEPWTYDGASEEALLAVEAMGSKVTSWMGTASDGRRVYRLREETGHRPFEVTFDAVGNPVGEPVEFRSVHHHNIPATKDLLAALVVKLERASIGYLCRGCGEMDPPDMEGDDWHVVIVQDHDPSPGGHGYDGECVTCPIEVQQQCGPIVQIGGNRGGL